MNHYVPKFLLGTKNNKTIKGEKYGWITYIMYLAPFTQNATGKNVCSHSSAGCVEACLFGSGKGSMSNVEIGRVNKTNYFLADRQNYLNQLYTEIDKLVKKHSKLDERVCIRLNGTSDLSWEKFKVKDNKSIIELFPQVQFYDYTKNYIRFSRTLPSNYHLTFSRSEVNDDKVEELLSQGHNVAVVFDKLPETYKGYKVVNGDLSDLRFKDEKNVVVGLKYKKMTGKGADNQKAFESGFALKIENLEEEKVAAAA